jgi:membrane protein YqaA with SNARE-associated domain
LHALKNLLLGYGAFGLFAIALVDSATVPLPGGPDSVLIWLSTMNPGRTPLYALLATIGSVLGCLILYRIGRTAGHVALARVKPETQRRLKRVIDRYDVLTMILAVMLPPPFPTKLVVLATGVFGMRWQRFAVGAFIGRALRFSLEGYLAARYGPQALTVLKQHYLMVILVAVIIVALLFWLNAIVKKNLVASEDQKAL